MPTSGSTDFNQTRDQIIADALSLIGRLGEGETPTPNTLTFCSNILNKLIKHWESHLHLWTTSEGTVFCRSGINKYILSPTGDKACDDSTLVETYVTVDSSGTSVTVASTEGMTIGDIIGVELDDNTRQWTTIATIPDSSHTTLNASLTTTASINRTVFSYTTNLGKALDIRSARRRIGIGQYSSDNEIRMTGRTDFMAIVNKFAPGSPNRGFYTAKVDSGVLHVWPTPDDCATRIKISYCRSIQDFDSGTDTPDLPSEWLRALTYNLAVDVASAYGVDLARKELTMIPAIAATSLEDLKAWDSENANIYIVPDDQF